ncbi:MAG: ABC transporter ATP-binding protein [Parvibaculaceae bacterium]
MTTETPHLELRGIRKTFGAFTALDAIDLAVRPGELLTLLGPSGSGKTTLLRVIAGFEQPDAGGVHLEGHDITDRPAAARNIGMVFQNYALFPHMTVSGNVAFPLEMRALPKLQIAERVAAALTLVDLADLGDRLPSQLSGGQQQRVALARALVFEPSLLLLDEPFGALDRKLREGLQLEVRRLQQRLGITTIFITHDQEEALILSDRIVVMDRGGIEQIGTPVEVYNSPASAFVADFVGESTIVTGRVTGSGNGLSEVSLDGGLRLIAAGEWARDRQVGVLFRPERMSLSTGSEANIFAGTVVESIFIGNAWRYRMRLPEGIDLCVRLPATAEQSAPQEGSRISVGVTPQAVHLFSLDKQGAHKRTSWRNA